jgi:hypothetical protein
LCLWSSPRLSFSLLLIPPLGRFSPFFTILLSAYVSFFYKSKV